jgi:hypothetical protein
VAVTYTVFGPCEEPYFGPPELHELRATRAAAAPTVQAIRPRMSTDPR